MFFEVSAKTGENFNIMVYTCIVELPFFEQFKNGNKEQIINEAGINKKEQNSIYDICKG